MTRRMVVRVALYGVVLLVLSALAVVIIGRAFLRPIFEERRDTTARWVARQVEPISHDPQRVRREIAELSPALLADVTVYGSDGSVIASSAHPPIAALAPEVAAVLPRQGSRLRPSDGAVAVGIFEGERRGGYLLVAHPSHGHDLLPGALALGAVLLVLVLASLHFARSLTAPIEQLGSVARSFGAGQLEARVGSRRADEIGDLGRTFDDMADRVVLLLRAQKELLANVSHELRTPLARIRVALELIQDGDAEQARAILPELGEDLAELERLVDDVLIATRLEFLEQGGGLPTMHKVETSLGDVVERSAARFRHLHPDCVLAVRIATDLPRLHADGALLGRAIGNLLDNAHKYSDPGTAVTLVARATDAEAILEVQDRGAGIPESDLPHVFTPFFRGDRSRTRETGGTGLGLPLAQRIVVAHGGTLEIESTLGQGTTLRVRLPTRGCDTVHPSP